MEPLSNHHNVLTGLACNCSTFRYAQETPAEETRGDAFLDRAAGTPHKGKVLLADQAHSEDIPLLAKGASARSTCARRADTALCVLGRCSRDLPFVD